jgi:hypothetical protein
MIVKEDRATHTTSFNFQQDHMYRAERFRQHLNMTDGKITFPSNVAISPLCFSLGPEGYTDRLNATIRTPYRPRLLSSASELFESFSIWLP